MGGKSITPETGRATATLHGQPIASTTSWLKCEGNVYFPPDALNRDGIVFSNTELLTYCPWKGHAGYYSVDVDGKKVENAAWYYSDPFDGALSLKDYVAFDKSKVNIDVE